MERKVCKKCQQELDVASFGKSKEAKDGLTGSCKQCRKAAMTSEQRHQAVLRAKAWKQANAHVIRHQEYDPIASMYNRLFLSDNYIRSRLRKSGLQLTQENINARRDAIEFQRSVASSGVAKVYTLLGFAARSNSNTKPYGRPKQKIRHRGATRVCCSCKQSLPVDSFSNRSTGTLKGECTKCILSRHQQACERLKDSYVGRIVASKYGMTLREVPVQMIQFKRAALTFKRTLRTLK